MTNPYLQPHVVEKVTDMDRRTFDFTLTEPLTRKEHIELRDWIERFEIDGTNFRCEIGTEGLRFPLQTFVVYITHVWVDTPKATNECIEPSLIRILEALERMGKIPYKPHIQFRTPPV